MRRAVPLLAGVVLAACAAHEDVTPVIHVDPRAAQRLALLGMAPPAAQAASPAAEPAKPAAARVHTMTDADALGGPNANGRAGDVMLENDEVVFVVGKTTGNAQQALGGALLDAADAHLRKDELGMLIPAHSLSTARAPYEWTTTGTGTDGSAWVEIRGEGVKTRYTLQAPDRALLVETTLENTAAEPVTATLSGDVIQWGSAQRVAPGKARGFDGPSSGAYVGAVGSFTSYAITSTEGTLDADSKGPWTTTAPPAAVKLAPHEKTSFTRVFVVGPRADTSGLVAELAMAAGQPVGAVKLDVASPAPGLELTLVPFASTEALTMAAPFEGVLPLGRYQVLAPGTKTPLPTLLDVKREGTAEMAVP